ncbi:Uncharacterized protein Fot_08478 [Forsythia ovata]|uniref:Uncharacterized protein n=1 Tax=Forsythia ovata TaxID=205694 RepID=A0ABD1WYX1_9LAMI
MIESCQAVEFVTESYLVFLVSRFQIWSPASPLSPLSQVSCESVTENMVMVVGVDLFYFEFMIESCQAVEFMTESYPVFLVSRFQIWSPASPLSQGSCESVTDNMVMVVGVDLFYRILLCVPRLS